METKDTPKNVEVKLSREAQTAQGALENLKELRDLLRKTGTETKVLGVKGSLTYVGDVAQQPRIANLLIGQGERQKQVRNSMSGYAGNLYTKRVSIPGVDAVRFAPHKLRGLIHVDFEYPGGVNCENASYGEIYEQDRIAQFRLESIAAGNGEYSEKAKRSLSTLGRLTGSDILWSFEYDIKETDAYKEYAKASGQSSDKPVQRKSRVKGAVRAVGLVGTAAVLAAGGVYASQHPEVIQGKAHEIGGFVETVGESIAERYHELKDDREAKAVPQVEQPTPPPVTPPSNESQNSIEVKYPYQEIIQKLLDDGKENGYYFVDVGDAVRVSSSSYGPFSLSPRSNVWHQLLFPEGVLNSDGSSSFVLIEKDGPKKLSVSNDDAQKIRDMMRQTIGNANKVRSNTQVPNSILAMSGSPKPSFTYLDVFNKKQVTIGIDSSRASNDEVLASIEQSRSKDRLGVSASPQTDDTQSLSKNIASLLKTATP